MGFRSDQDPEAIAARLQQDRDDISRAFSELRERLMPKRSAGEAGADLWASAREAGGKTAARLAGGAGEGALKLAQSAGAAAKANPVAAVVAGGGLAVLAWAGLKAMQARNAAPLPEWLAGADALAARAEKLSQRIDAAEAEGALSPREAEDSRADVAEGMRQELRRLMGLGLDGLEPKTRAAAYAARQEAWDRHSGKSGPLAGLLGKGTLMALAGAGLSAYLTRQGSNARPAENRADAAAEALQALNAARAGFAGEADRLTRMAGELSRSLNAAFAALEENQKARPREEEDRA